MKNLDSLDSAELARVLGGSKPDLSFLSRGQKACTTKLSSSAQKTGLDDQQIAAKCGLSPALQTKYVNAIQNWEDKIDP